MSTDLRDIFEDEFARPPSDVQEQAARAALGDDYPTGLETYSWVSRTELRRAAEIVSEDSGAIADVGCGRGGPGIWVAGIAGRPLIGIDIAESALVRARALAGRLAVEADFRAGSFEDTGLSDAAAGSLLSFDAFLFAPDKQAAMAELVRVLSPGGHLVMTSWDYHSQPANRPPQVEDHRPLAESAGLEVVSYVDTDDWHRRCVVMADLLLDRAEELAREAGEPVEQVRAAVMEMRATIDCMTRRFLMVARRPT